MRRPCRNTEVPVSVVVPTYNSEQYLHSCLESIRSQTYDNVELIVVDNESVDRTKEIASQHTDHVYVRGLGRSASRNFGAENAKGEFVFFVDSDMELGRGVIESCVAACESVDCVIVPERSVGKGFWAKCKSLERSCYVGDDTIEAARFFHRSAFRSVGGYDEGLLAGEDWDLHQRVKGNGLEIGRIQEFIVHHEGELKLFETVRTKYQYGKTVDFYLSKHPERAREQFHLIRPAFKNHWRRLARYPYLTTGMFFMKGCEYAAGGLGLLNRRIQRRISNYLPNSVTTK